jgi:hypothetical protein
MVRDYLVMAIKQVDSFKDYADKQRGFGEVPTPELWWSQWLTESGRGFIISRLQESDARCVREYGAAKVWRRIPERQQNMLVNI